MAEPRQRIGAPILESDKSSLVTGLRSLKANVYDAGAVAAQVLGFEEKAQDWQNTAIQEHEIAASYRPDAPTFTEVIENPSLQRVGSFVENVVGEQAPLIASGIIGGIGSGGVGAVGAGLARQAALAAGKKALAKKIVPKAVGAVAGKIGGTVPIAAATTGETAARLREEAPDSTLAERAPTALLSGAIQTPMEYMPISRGIDRMLGKGGRALIRSKTGENRALNAISGAIASGTEEAATEALQNLTQDLTVKLQNPEASVFSVRDTIDAAGAGLVLGALLGGLGGSIRTPRNMNNFKKRAEQVVDRALDSGEDANQQLEAFFTGNADTIDIAGITPEDLQSIREELGTLEQPKSPLDREIDSIEIEESGDTLNEFVDQMLVEKLGKARSKAKALALSGNEEARAKAEKEVLKLTKERDRQYNEYVRKRALRVAARLIRDEVDILKDPDTLSFVGEHKNLVSQYMDDLRNRELEDGAEIAEDDLKAIEEGSTVAEATTDAADETQMKQRMQEALGVNEEMSEQEGPSGLVRTDTNTPFVNRAQAKKKAKRLGIAEEDVIDLNELSEREKTDVRQLVDNEAESFSQMTKLNKTQQKFVDKAAEAKRTAESATGITGREQDFQMKRAARLYKEAASMITLIDARGQQQIQKEVELAPEEILYEPTLSQYKTPIIQDMRKDLGKDASEGDAEAIRKQIASGEVKRKNRLLVDGVLPGGTERVTISINTQQLNKVMSEKPGGFAGTKKAVARNMLNGLSALAVGVTRDGGELNFGGSIDINDPNRSIKFTADQLDSVVYSKKYEGGEVQWTLGELIESLGVDKFDFLKDRRFEGDIEDVKSANERLQDEGDFDENAPAETVEREAIQKDSNAAKGFETETKTGEFINASERSGFVTKAAVQQTNTQGARAQRKIEAKETSIQGKVVRGVSEAEQNVADARVAYENATREHLAPEKSKQKESETLNTPQIVNARTLLKVGKEELAKAEKPYQKNAAQRKIDTATQILEAAGIEVTPKPKKKLGFPMNKSFGKLAVKIEGKLSLVSGKLGHILANSTFDAMVLGERTATTRRLKPAKWPMEGQVVRMWSGTVNRSGYIDVLITKGPVEIDPDNLTEEWAAKEGWTLEKGKQVLKEMQGTDPMVQFEYKVLDNARSRNIRSLLLRQHLLEADLITERAKAAVDDLIPGKTKAEIEVEALLKKETLTEAEQKRLDTLFDLIAKNKPTIEGQFIEASVIRKRVKQLARGLKIPSLSRAKAPEVTEKVGGPPAPSASAVEYAKGKGLTDAQRNEAARRRAKESSETRKFWADLSKRTGKILQRAQDVLKLEAMKDMPGVAKRRGLAVAIESALRQSRYDLSLYEFMTGIRLKEGEVAPVKPKKRDTIFLNDVKEQADEPTHPFNREEDEAVNKRHQALATTWINSLGLKDGTARIKILTGAEAEAATRAAAERAGEDPNAAVDAARINGRLYPNYNGEAGTYAIFISDRLPMSRQIEVLAHEVGHLLTYEIIYKDKDLRAKLEEEWETQFRSQHGENSLYVNVLADRKPTNAVILMYRNAMEKGVENFTLKNAADQFVEQGIFKNAEEFMDYHLGFSEYMADQIARWLTTNEKPRSAIEVAFEQLANLLKRLFIMAGVVHQKKANEYVADWLNKAYKPQPVNLAPDTAALHYTASEAEMHQSLFNLAASSKEVQDNLDIIMEFGTQDELMEAESVSDLKDILDRATKDGVEVTDSETRLTKNLLKEIPASSRLVRNLITIAKENGMTNEQMNKIKTVGELLNWFKKTLDEDGYYLIETAVGQAKEQAQHYREAEKIAQKIRAEIERVVGEAPVRRKHKAAKFDNVITGGRHRNFIVLAERFYGDPMSDATRESLIWALRDGTLFKPEEKRVIVNTFSKGSIRRRLFRKLQNNPEALERARKNPMVAAAYGFQLWNAGDLSLTPRMDNIFQRLLAKIRKLFGIVAESTQTEEFFDHFRKGEVIGRKLGNNSFEVASQLTDTRTRQTYAWLAETSRPFRDLLSKAFSPAAEQIRRLNNPALTALLRQIAILPSDDAGEAESMIAARGNQLGVFIDELHEIFGEGDLADLQKDPVRAKRIADIINGVIEPETAEEKAMYKKIRKWFNRLYDYSVEAGIGIQYIKGYIPRVLDTIKLDLGKEQFIAALMQEKYNERMQEWLGREKPLSRTEQEAVANKIFNAYMGHYGDPESVADELLREERGGTKAAGNIGAPLASGAKQRQLQWIDEEDINQFYDDRVGIMMTKYANQMVKRAEFMRRFGQDKYGKAKPGRRLIEDYLEEARQYGASEDDIQLAENFVKATMGLLAINEINPQFQKLQGWLLVVQNYALLPLATITSLVDPIGIAVRGDLDTAMHAFMVGMKQVAALIRREGKTEERSFAELIGSVEKSTTLEALGMGFGGYYTTGAARRANEFLFQINGLTRWTDFTRTIAAAGATHFIRKHVFRGTEESQRYLQELGVNPADVEDSETLGILGRDEVSQLNYDLNRVKKTLRNVRSETYKQELTAELKELTERKNRDERLRAAVNRFVDQSILRPDASQRPLWGSDPRFMLIMHLKSFTWSFQEVILKRVYNEVLEGHYAPLMSLMAYAPAAFMTIVMKDLLRGAFDDDDEREYTWGSALWQGVDKGGLLGTMSWAADSLNDWQRGGSGITSSMTGPTLQNTGMWAAAIADFDGTSNKELKALARTSPGFVLWKDWFDIGEGK